MGSTENKQLVRRSFEELSSGNPQALLDNMADDVCYTIGGETKYSGVLRGKSEIIERLLVPLSEEIEGGISFVCDNLVADERFVVMQSHGFAKAKNGKPYNNTYCHVFRINEGKIVELTEYLDTAMAADVFGTR
jgi:hypothetical protein